LDEIRDELGLSNDWPVSELLDMLVTDEGKSMVEGSEKLRDMSMLFMLDSTQINPGPGYDRETMYEFIGKMKPYAVFVKVPISGEGDSLTYLWDELDKYSADVVYADSPQLLEAAVWEYRLNFALRTEIKEIKAEGHNPTVELLGLDAGELGALFEELVMHGFRLYGATSAVRARQEELDILREENGDLVVRAPLKPEIEPVRPMAAYRDHLDGNELGMIMHLKFDSDAVKEVWPTVRASNYYMVKVRHGRYIAGSEGKLHIKGFLEQAVLEWFMAESLADLYRIARLGSVYEMLSACGYVEGQVRPT
jgi:hypothetical protein